MVVTLAVLTWILHLNNATDIKASHYLQEDLELSLHAAGLAIRTDQLAEGLVVFDTEQSYQHFVQSFEMNTNLRNMNPVSHSFFQDEFRVLSYEIYDDSNTSIFPFRYNHPLYAFEQQFEGPTIIAIIETFGPRYLNGDKQMIRRAAAYTYAR